MQEVMRSIYYDDGKTVLSTDSGALPCPRCQCAAITTESHPATGQMASCSGCGARGNLKDWNDGSFDLVYNSLKKHFEYINRQHYKRPRNQSVKVVRKPGCERFNKLTKEE